ncbi:MAG: SDR family NAD(P)-dependent oxidoreductase [Gemmatimonadota bacterium]|nr:SDR family NAD(P)-dependent oxidoreductase [Gemmatimonadota bacterium]MDH3369041.1 SDR family NAD(P)-dependent oxidoreductase [Gemmatimonadota bacterium]MDH3479813.1 SDR family NAD(P)-dependent oxidoreductase [Gemmatimonadota bacterium]MDH3569194.1 SDR family NAD(P)-dependent oxidoreductase [Gemmatimonadota bacterium]MDH5550557.1 SDR family NAD(P)-dependent oxidoreductase [Gemmatimonadota bacterium]
MAGSGFGTIRGDFTWTRRLAKDALRGMKAAVVGGTNGIGRALARAIVARGADVLVVGRTFRDPDVPGLSFLQADLSSLKSARSVAQELPAETLDLVVMTQGIVARRQRLTTPTASSWTWPSAT